MEPKQPRTRPERKIQDEVIVFLEHRGWFVNETHGNMFQSGFPDLYCTHMEYGQRWVECKTPDQYSFTSAQIKCFTKWSGCGIKIWIMTAATEVQYKRVLCGTPNWHEFLSCAKVHTRNRRIIC